MNGFSDVIDLWPTREDFARDVGVSGVVARAWWQRDSIPSAFWLRVVSAAAARGAAGEKDAAACERFGAVTLALLADMAARKVRVSERDVSSDHAATVPDAERFRTGNDSPGSPLSIAQVTPGAGLPVPAACPLASD